MRKFSKIISVVLLCLFAEYLCSITLFPHSHIIDGRIVTHSHPYTGSADSPGHAHSALHFETIANLSLLLMLLAALPWLASIYFRREELLFSYSFRRAPVPDKLFLQRRGPPVR